MAAIAGLPYFELEFDKDAKLVHPEQQQAVIDAVRADAETTDLLVISHGWNNDMDEARGLYQEFFTNLAADFRGDGATAARRFVILGVLWPSKKFAEHDLIPGGAASAGNDAAADAVLLEQIGILESLTGRDLSELRTLAPKLADSKSAREQFSTTVLSLMPLDASEDDHHLAPTGLATDVAADRLLERLSRPSVSATVSQGGAASIGDSPTMTTSTGSAAGLGDLFSGVKAGAMNLLNVTTYYQMRSRAGKVGEEGVNPVLRAIRAEVPSVRLHLIGHSFGGRVVTAAVAGAANDPPLLVDTMSLLQAAFSHYAFAENWDGKQSNGPFRRVVSPAGAFVKSGVIVTHTRADKAVGIAYAIASRANNQIASGLGDAGDKFGGLGGNGALKTPEHIDVKINRNGERYAFTPGKVHNIDGNGVITGHSDIRRSEVTHAVADVVRLAAI